VLKLIGELVDGLLESLALTRLVSFVLDDVELKVLLDLLDLLLTPATDLTLIANNEISFRYLQYLLLYQTTKYHLVI